MWIITQDKIELFDVESDIVSHDVSSGTVKVGDNVVLRILSVHILNCDNNR